MKSLLPDGTQDVSVCQPIPEGKEYIIALTIPLLNILPDYNWIHCDMYIYRRTKLSRRE